MVVIFGFPLLAVGIILASCSLFHFPFLSTEEYSIPYSQTFYDHYEFNISPNSSEVILVEGEEAYELLKVYTDLNIHFEVQPSNIDLQIEYTAANYAWAHVGPHTWVRVLHFCWEWSTVESYCNISSLNITFPSRIQEVHRLRFKNNDLQTNKSVELSAVAKWTENSYRDVTVYSSLLPFEFAYIGVPALLIGATILIRGITTGQVTFTREHARKLLEDIEYHIQMREIVLSLLLTCILLFLSFIGHTRFSAIPITVSTFTMDIPIMYFGFPFEMIGSLTPLTRRQTAHILAYTQVERGSRLQILGKGLFLNVVIYFTLAFFIVYLYKKFRD